MSKARTEESASRSKRAFIRAAVAGLVLLSGLGLVKGLEISLDLTFEKPYRPLTKPLALMRREIGIPVRYKAGPVDRNLEPDIVEALGTKEYLLRPYFDQTKKPGDVGYELDLNLNYFGTGSATPHVPEVCWKGAGMVEADDSKKEFVVPGVRRLDGTVEDVRMRLISFVPNQTDPSGLNFGVDTGDKYQNVAYLFEVNGKCVAQPGEVLSEFWNAKSKYAYHTKIEVTVPGATTQAQAIAAISDFIKASLADVEECLPEKEGAGGAGVTSNDSRETR